MSCPYFYPVEPRTSLDDRASAMLPLGGAWAGVCRAVAGQPWQPGESTLRLLCNLGYARGSCSRFPSGDGPDAVRFTVRADDGACLRLYHVIERDHHPFAHGPLEYSLAGRALSGSSSSGDIVARQAQAYAESYVRRKKEAAGGSAASE